METLVKLNSGKGGDISLVCNALQTIVIPIDVYAELVEYVKHYDTEVSGVGLVDKEESIVEIGEYTVKEKIHTITYKITELFLPPAQDNSGASTEIEETAIAEIVGKLIKEGKDPSKLKLHWHSHCNMQTFHSGVDEDNYRDLNNKEFLVSLVINKKREVLGRVDIYSPIDVAFINVPVFISTTIKDGVNEKIKFNLEALDKYVNDKKSKNVIGFHQKDWNYNWSEEKIKSWQREWRIKNKLRTQMKLKAEVAWTFEECTSPIVSCGYCTNAKECGEYKRELAKRLRSKE